MGHAAKKSNASPAKACRFTASKTPDALGVIRYGVTPWVFTDPTRAAATGVMAVTMPTATVAGAARLCIPIQTQAPTLTATHGEVRVRIPATTQHPVRQARTQAIRGATAGPTQAVTHAAGLIRAKYQPAPQPTQRRRILSAAVTEAGRGAEAAVG